LVLLLALIVVAGVGIEAGAGATERFLITPTGFDFGEVVVGESSPRRARS
jgi:hypothetical protein